MTTGEFSQGQVVVERIAATMATVRLPMTTVTADAGYAYAKDYGALEHRGIAGRRSASLLTAFGSR